MTRFLPTPSFKWPKSNPKFYILHLMGGVCELFSLSGRSLIRHTEDLVIRTPADLKPVAEEFNNAPWLILVDQPEEEFWGELMPPLRGKARTAWLERLAAKKNFESLFDWVQIQGRSRSSPPKYRVLGYSLGQSAALVEWLAVLSTARIRVRGVYSPPLLAETATKLLDIEAKKVSVIVTHHHVGLRQCVMVDGKIRFSRLAFTKVSFRQHWATVLAAETERLHDYLVGNGLLKRSSTPMHVVYVQPDHSFRMERFSSSLSDIGNTYHCLKASSVETGLGIQPSKNTLSKAQLFYVWLLALRQPANQLAPLAFRQFDVSNRIVRAVLAFGAGGLLIGFLYAVFSFVQTQKIRPNVESSKRITTEFEKKYLVKKETFPKSPVSTDALLELDALRQTTFGSRAPTPAKIMSMLGQVMNRYEQFSIDELLWRNEPVSSTGGGDTQFERRSVEILYVRGGLSNLAAENLRGGRDAMLKFVSELRKNDGLNVDIVRMPFDLLPGAAVSGSGEHSQAELNYEVKLWLNHP